VEVQSATALCTSTIAVVYVILLSMSVFSSHLDKCVKDLVQGLFEQASYVKAPFCTTDLKSHSIAESIRSRAQKKSRSTVQESRFSCWASKRLKLTLNKQGFRQVIL